MKTFTVTYTETKVYEGIVEAETLEQAADRVRDGYVEEEELIEKDITIDELKLDQTEESDNVRSLVVNCGEYNFTDFNRAVNTLSEEYGFEGEAWEMVVASGDLEILSDFLNADGLNAEIE
ncbi:hypothetical protein [Bacillus cereus]|uniref:hypothetical protein n=1 Tax=Bacillus TaxID=1386 RepID=UPI00211D2A91|nr:hypothetical protein [Bacillus cereus]MCU4771683.1 hypothetical protein [Bacillus cereus]MEB9411388.1 hypothetical protein [Bacillus cereus]